MTTTDGITRHLPLVSRTIISIVLLLLVVPTTTTTTTTATVSSLETENPLSTTTHKTTNTNNNNKKNTVPLTNTGVANKNENMDHEVHQKIRTLGEEEEGDGYGDYSINVNPVRRAATASNNDHGGRGGGRGGRGGGGHLNNWHSRMKRQRRSREKRALKAKQPTTTDTALPANSASNDILQGGGTGLGGNTQRIDSSAVDSNAMKTLEETQDAIRKEIEAQKKLLADQKAQLEALRAANIAIEDLDLKATKGN